MGDPGKIIFMISVVFLKKHYTGSFEPRINFSGHNPHDLLTQKGYFLAVFN